jgi:hypothetical protein
VDTPLPPCPSRLGGRGRVCRARGTRWCRRGRRLRRGCGGVVLASGQRRWLACRRSGRCAGRVRVPGRGTVATRRCYRGGVAQRDAELRALGGDYERLARVLRPPIRALVGAGQRCQHAQRRVTAPSRSRRNSATGTRIVGPIRIAWMLPPAMRRLAVARLIESTLQAVLIGDPRQAEGCRRRPAPASSRRPSPQADQ